MLSPEFIKDIEQVARFLATFLIFSYLFSLLARLHWTFDLFSHFIIQYAIGGLVLALILASFNKWPLAVLCFAVFVLSAYEIYQRFPIVTSVHGEKHVTIAQYNRLYHNHNYDGMLDWLRKNSNEFDVVSIQEITEKAVQELQKVNDIYPYRFPAAKTPGTDAYLLSRHPILESEFITNNADVPTALGLRIVTETPAGLVTIYSIHTHTPMSKRMQLQRNSELIGMADKISKDSSQNIIFVGDWNITPFSPHFGKILNISGLNNEYTSRLLPVTWPSFFILPFLKIPIDHAIASDNLKLVKKTTDISNGSDHQSMIITFEIKPD